jgi:predicted dehydrogenase
MPRFGKWLKNKNLGEIKKLFLKMVMDQSNGCSKEFTNWLTDPIQNGEDIVDFGCYGANIMTWLMDGQNLFLSLR